MHDDLIERRLRAALHDEAGRQPFTITAPELERRAVLRRRRGPSRLSLLLAAAVAIGAVGVGAVMGGFIDGPLTADPSIAPPASASATSGPDEPQPTATFPAIGPGPMALPDLDSLVADVGAETVLYASAHGAPDGQQAVPAGMRDRQVMIGLGTVDAGTRYEILAVCLGARELVVNVSVPLNRAGPGFGDTPVPCDGTLLTYPVMPPEHQALSLRTSATASWRVLVRRLDGAPPRGTAGIPVLDPEVLTEILIDRATEIVDTDVAAPGANGLVLQEVGAVPVRETYRLLVWCDGGPFLRAIAGDHVDGKFLASTITQLPCDNREHHVTLSVPEPGGSPVYVEAAPGTRWSMLVGAVPPPISPIAEEPGWTLSSSIGPELSFDTEEHAFTGIADQNGEGRARVALSCAGAGTIEVGVEVHAPMDDGQPDETFTVECGAGPSTTAMTFEDTQGYLTVHWTSHPGQWTAVTILTPERPS